MLKYWIVLKSRRIGKPVTVILAYMWLPIFLIGMWMNTLGYTDNYWMLAIGMLLGLPIANLLGELASICAAHTFVGIVTDIGFKRIGLLPELTTEVNTVFCRGKEELYILTAGMKMNLFLFGLFASLNGVFQQEILLGIAYGNLLWTLRSSIYCLLRDTESFKSQLLVFSGWTLLPMTFRYQCWNFIILILQMDVHPIMMAGKCLSAVQYMFLILGVEVLCVEGLCKLLKKGKKHVALQRN